MIYRTTVAGIILFWGIMAALLVRTEFFSGNGESLPVPVAFVLKLMFRHEQPADLTLYAQRHRLDGALHLQPRRLPPGIDGRALPLNLVSGSGSFALSLPGVAAQRVVLRGLMELDESEQVQRLELTASLHEPRQTGPGTTILLEGHPAANLWHYVVRQAGVTVREDTGPVSNLLAALDPHLPGLDLRVFEQAQRQQVTALRITAHRGTLRLNGDEIDTYVVDLRHGESSEASIHFNQLGQILAVKTFAGYDLYDDAVVP